MIPTPRTVVCVLAAGFLAGCSGIKTYPDTSPRNLFVKTEASSGSAFSRMRAGTRISFTPLRSSIRTTASTMSASPCRRISSSVRQGASLIAPTPMFARGGHTRFHFRRRLRLRIEPLFFLLRLPRAERSSGPEQTNFRLVKRGREVREPSQCVERRERTARDERDRARQPLARTVHQVGNIQIFEKGSEVQVNSTLQVIEFRNDDIERLQQEVARAHGYRLVSHRLELFAVPLDSEKETEQ